MFNKSSFLRVKPLVFVGSIIMGVFMSKRITNNEENDHKAIVDKCVFCNIIREDKVTVYQDEDVYVFSDRTPKASTHYLVIPKEHIKSVKTLTPNDLPIILKMKKVAEDIVENNFKGSEYRLGFHIPPFYSIPHLHLHLLVEPFTPPRKRFNYTPHLGGLWYKSVDTIIESLNKTKDHIV